MPTDTHNNLNLLFFNTWILWNPSIKDLKEYGKKKPETKYLKPESFGLSNSNCRHKKVIDMLDEQCFKPLSVIKENPGFAKLNWFTYFRLKTTLKKLSIRNPGLRLTSTGVTHSSDKKGRTPLDYISCVSDLFKRINKGSSCYRRILLQLHTPRGITTNNGSSVDM